MIGSFKTLQSATWLYSGCLLFHPSGEPASEINRYHQIIRSRDRDWPREKIEENSRYEFGDDADVVQTTLHISKTHIAVQEVDEAISSRMVVPESIYCESVGLVRMTSEKMKENGRLTHFENQACYEDLG